MVRKRTMQNKSGSSTQTKQKSLTEEKKEERNSKHQERTNMTYHSAHVTRLPDNLRLISESQYFEQIAKWRSHNSIIKALMRSGALSIEEFLKILQSHMDFFGAAYPLQQFQKKTEDCQVDSTKTVVTAGNKLAGAHALRTAFKNADKDAGVHPSNYFEIRVRDCQKGAEAFVGWSDPSTGLLDLKSAGAYLQLKQVDKEVQEREQKKAESLIQKATQEEIERKHEAKRAGQTPDKNTNFFGHGKDDPIEMKSSTFAEGDIVGCEYFGDKVAFYKNGIKCADFDIPKSAVNAVPHVMLKSCEMWANFGDLPFRYLRTTTDNKLRRYWKILHAQHAVEQKKEKEQKDKKREAKREGRTLGIVANGKADPPVYVAKPETWSELISLASETVGFPVTRVFTESGTTVGNIKSVRNFLVVSGGEDFVPLCVAAGTSKQYVPALIAKEIPANLQTVTKEQYETTAQKWREENNQVKAKMDKIKSGKYPWEMFPHTEVVSLLKERATFYSSVYPFPRFVQLGKVQSPTSDESGSMIEGETVINQAKGAHAYPTAFSERQRQRNPFPYFEVSVKNSSKPGKNNGKVLVSWSTPTTTYEELKKSKVFMQLRKAEKGEKKQVKEETRAALEKQAAKRARVQELKARKEAGEKLTPEEHAESRYNNMDKDAPIELPSTIFFKKDVVGCMYFGDRIVFYKNGLKCASFDVPLTNVHPLPHVVAIRCNVWANFGDLPFMFHEREDVYNEFWPQLQQEKDYVLGHSKQEPKKRKQTEDSNSGDTPKQENAAKRTKKNKTKKNKTKKNKPPASEASTPAGNATAEATTEKAAEATPKKAAEATPKKAAETSTEKAPEATPKKAAEATPKKAAATPKRKAPDADGEVAPVETPKGKVQKPVEATPSKSKAVEATPKKASATEATPKRKTAEAEDVAAVATETPKPKTPAPKQNPQVEAAPTPTPKKGKAETTATPKKGNAVEATPKKTPAATPKRKAPEAEEDSSAQITESVTPKRKTTTAATPTPKRKTAETPKSKK